MDPSSSGKDFGWANPASERGFGEQLGCSFPKKITWLNARVYGSMLSSRHTTISRLEKKKKKERIDSWSIKKEAGMGRRVGPFLCRGRRRRRRAHAGLPPRGQGSASCVTGTRQTARGGSHTYHVPHGSKNIGGLIFAAKRDSGSSSLQTERASEMTLLRVTPTRINISFSGAVTRKVQFTVHTSIASGC